MNVIVIFYILCFFRIIDHLPLIAGISGGAILTLILIAIIACRLTRNSDKDKYKQANTQDPGGGAPPDHTFTSPPSYTPDNAADMNGSMNNGNGRPNTKEWFV